jgi:hypothetical protein
MGLWVGFEAELLIFFLTRDSDAVRGDWIACIYMYLHGVY